MTLSEMADIRTAQCAQHRRADRRRNGAVAGFLIGLCLLGAASAAPMLAEGIASIAADTAITRTLACQRGALCGGS